MKVFLHTVLLDAKQLELIKVFFLNDPRCERVYDRKEADFVVLDAKDLLNYPIMDNGKYIIIDYYDIANKQVGLRGAADRDFRRRVTHIKAKLIYLKQAYYHIAKREEIDDAGIIMLSIPIFFSGSIHYRDLFTYDERGLILENIEPNKKSWKYEFCFINGNAGHMREPVYNSLTEYGKMRGMAVCTKLEEIKSAAAIAILSENYGLEYIKKRAEFCDIDKYHSVPFNDVIKYLRQSKVAVGCSGNSAFCARDSEALSRNVFYLRSYHKDFNVNPLSPKDGKHLVFFHMEDLYDKLTYYLENEVERERINDQGFEYFKDGATGGWARAYVDMFDKYLKTSNKRAFEGFTL